MKLTAFLIFLLTSIFSFASEMKSLSAGIYISDSKGNISPQTFVEKFSEPKGSKKEQIAHIQVSVSPNCFISIEAITDNNFGERGISLFTWLLSKNRDLSIEEQKKLCGPNAVESAWSTHIYFDEQATSSFRLDTDILKLGKVENIDLDLLRYKFWFKVD